MPTHWAIDLGTSNTTICEDRSGRPHVVNLPDLAKPGAHHADPGHAVVRLRHGRARREGPDRPGGGHLQLGRAGHRLRARLQAPSGHGARPGPGARRRADLHRVRRHVAVPARGRSRPRGPLRRRGHRRHHRHAERLLRNLPGRAADDSPAGEAPRLVEARVGARSGEAGDRVPHPGRAGRGRARLRRRRRTAHDAGRLRLRRGNDGGGGREDPRREDRRDGPGRGAGEAGGRARRRRHRPLDSSAARPVGPARLARVGGRAPLGGRAREAPRERGRRGRLHLPQRVLRAAGLPRPERHPSRKRPLRADPRTPRRSAHRTAARATASPPAPSTT